MEQEPTISHPHNPGAAPPHTSPHQRHRIRERLKGALSTIVILIAAPIIALSLTAFVFQSYEVDGPSMQNTLQPQDRLIVWKVPRTIARITGNDYLPKRGDIVVFNRQGISGVGESQNKQLIKRVIALPGERIMVQGGIMTVYNKERPEGFNPDASGDYPAPTQPTRGSLDITVPDGKVFVSGDNRNNSLDSRDFGAIPAHDIVGVLAFRLFPLNKVKAF